MNGCRSNYGPLCRIEIVFLHGLSFTENATVLLFFVAPCSLVLLVQESHKREMFVNADAE
jgi:hypothetical protein